MATHVDELVSDVTVEPEPNPGPASGPLPDWESAARLAEQLRRQADLERRTAAGGFDD